MGAIYLILISTACIVSAVPVEESTLARGPYPRYIQFPDGDGVMQDVDLEAEPDMEVLNDIAKNPASNVYLLYTKRNPTSPQILVMSDPKSIQRSNFNSKVPSVVVVHGWLSNQNSPLNPAIRDAYLNKADDVNVIIVDWSRVAYADYLTSVNGVPAVGRGVGQFLGFLSSVSGASFDSMHLVGFSLGAHVVGNAGRELGGKVARITGLDPAGPLWNLNRNRLASHDGLYVEVIHTDGAIDGIGIGTASGDVDFFPNGGTTQPGCLTSICNHNRAWEFFAASVSYNHLIGRSCNTYIQMTLNICRGAILPMGNDNLRKTGSGKFRVNTGRRYPF